jgi:hypothetical protein
MRFWRLLLPALGASAMLCVFTSPAFARILLVSHQRMRATFANVEFIGAFGTTRCALTLEGSLHARSLNKLVATLLGYLARGTLGACSSGTATILAETLPWHIHYEFFTGTLPNITAIGILISFFSMRIREVGGLTCLVRTTATEPGRGTWRREAGGALTQMTLGGEIRTGGECFGSTGTLAGTSSTLTNETGGRITITLI